MKYPFKYPRLYGELAMQGKEKTDLAEALGLTVYQLRNRQNLEINQDFGVGEMIKASEFLDKSTAELFDLDPAASTSA